MKLNDYINGWGLSKSDLTAEELVEVEKELEIINGGGVVLDSVLDSVGYRKK